MSRFLRLLPTLLLAACSAPPPAAAPTVTAKDDPPAPTDRVDWTTRALCRAATPQGTSRRAKQIWGKNDGPPGLARDQVETFLCEKEPELESACWAHRFEGWDGSEVEYGVVVDPSGAVLEAGNELLDGSAAAQLTRGSERTTSPALSHCVAKVIDGWRFPRATMPTWMTLSFRFPD